jgi:hypothetical protein
MFTKSALLAPLSALILVAGAGCGGAAMDPDEGAPAAEETTAPSPDTQAADEAVKPADDVGKTEDPWVAAGRRYGGVGYGRGYGVRGRGYGYGVGYPGNINGGFNRLGRF